MYDCKKCGICCVGFEDGNVFCNMSKSDLSKLSPRFVYRNVISILGHADCYAAIKTRWKVTKTGPFKGYEFNICAALRGSIMNQVSCSIYKNRPMVCKTAVIPGDRTCEDLREVYLQKLEEII